MSWDELSGFEDMSSVTRHAIRVQKPLKTRSLQAFLGFLRGEASVTVPPVISSPVLASSQLSIVLRSNDMILRRTRTVSSLLIVCPYMAMGGCCCVWKRI